MAKRNYDWIEVGDRLPKGSGVLCIVAIDLGDGIPDTVPGIADFHNGRFEVYGTDYDEGIRVTHWTPFEAKMPVAGGRSVPTHNEKTLAPVFKKLRAIAMAGRK